MRFESNRTEQPSSFIGHASYYGQYACSLHGFELTRIAGYDERGAKLVECVECGARRWVS